MNKSLLLAGLAVAGVFSAWLGCSSSSGSAAGPTTAASTGTASTQSTGSASTGSAAGGSTTGTATTGAGGGSGGGPSGMGGAAANFTCTVPTPAASNGACVVFFAPDGGEADAGVDTMGDATTTVCNPVTNAGCTGSDACGPDIDDMNYYCLPAGSPANVAVCGDCSATDATCAPGLICAYVSNTEAYCAALCCSDSDCGTGKCDPAWFTTPLPDGVGICH